MYKDKKVYVLCLLVCINIIFNPLNVSASDTEEAEIFDNVPSGIEAEEIGAIET